MPHEPVLIDPDVDLHDPAQRAEAHRLPWDLLAAIAVGGIAGSEARYGVAEALPNSGTGFPWSTLLINATGCLLIGVLMVIILELTSPHRLLRPFLAVGVLGGYTTYSTFAVDAQHLVITRHAGLALAYVLLTLTSCLLAVFAATVATRLIGRIVLESGVRKREERERG